MGRKRVLFLADWSLTPQEKIQSVGILCENDRIIGIGGASSFSQSEPGLNIIDLHDSYALPGFIDSHIHGIEGLDAALITKGAFDLPMMCRSLARHGVTTFFPTVESLPRDEFLETLSQLAGQIESGCCCIDPHGIHVEGPFLNPEKRGSQDYRNLMQIDLGFAMELIQAGKGKLKIMTFAPELKNADKLVELMLENGVIPSMGHSLADEADTLRCIDAGAHRCTYVFNGMPTLFHREATLTTLALTDDRVSVEMIVDGVHVHPRMVDLVTRCKPKDKIIGISNSVAAVSGEHQNSMPTRDNLEVIKTEDGVMAGTTLTLENSWFHLMNYAHAGQNTAAACFTANPAKDLGLITRGELYPGRRADITFFDSKTNRVRMTVARGEIVFDRDAAEQQQQESHA